MFEKSFNFGTPFFRAAERRVNQALDRPSANCYLSKDSGHAVIELLLPGYSKDDVEISLRKTTNSTTQQLHITGSIKDQLGEQYNAVSVGFSLKSKFTYVAELPLTASVQSVTLKNGLLRVLVSDFERVATETVIPVAVED